jgi:hypothetical protein
MADLDTPARIPGASGVGSMLTRKYAGIPAFVILLVVAGGAYLYIRSRKSYSPLGSTGSSGADPTDTGLGNEGAYNASGQPQIVFIPATSDSATNPNTKHPAGGTKGNRNKGGPTFTGKGARGYGTGRHGKGPQSTRQRYPVKHPIVRR